MPELPEVETIRRDLHAELVGRRVERVSVTGLRSVRRHLSPADFVGLVEGGQLVDTARRGKYLILLLGSGTAVVVHLGMSGQLLLVKPTNDPVRHTHVVLSFGDGPELRFVDPRTFGELFATPPTGMSPGLPDVPELSHLGFDPLDDAITPARLETMLGNRRTRLKPLLMDQRFVAGIGNMYADEILFAARLRPDRASDGLTRAEVARLRGAITDVLSSAIEHRGSSLSDEQYRDLYGIIGGYQLLHRVYAREGRPCTRCSKPILRVKGGGRSSFYCPRCQR